MRLFDPKKEVKRLLPEEIAIKQLKQEVARLTLEFNAYKDKINKQKQALDADQQKYIESAYKTRSELISEVGELEQRKIELEQSTNAKVLEQKIKDYNKKTADIDSLIISLKHQQDELEYEKAHYKALEADLAKAQRFFNDSADAVQKIMQESNQHEVAIKQASERLNALLDCLASATANWEDSALKNLELTKQLEDVIDTKLKILENQRKELDAKQRQIFSQQSALKTYAKDRRQ